MIRDIMIMICYSTGAAKWPVTMKDAEDLRVLLEDDCRTGSKS